MTTRELTTAEAEIKETAWTKYLATTDRIAADNHGVSSVVDAQNAWEEYQDTLAAHGIIGTLAGYRKRIA